ncbi:MAG: hypothetical protein K9I84_10550 [Leadbetterella sp.]|jgi:zona occludens toxin (predicted ATPase)|nr:hypothetical protein [Leadbetterella sp.]
MKKLVLFLLMVSATLSLSSFGIVSNPRMADQQHKAGKSMVINSKSSVNSTVIFNNPVEIKDSGKTEEKLESGKSLLKSFFALIISTLSQIVMTLVSK